MVREKEEEELVVTKKKCPLRGAKNAFCKLFSKKVWWCEPTRGLKQKEIFGLKNRR
jgi:hypothetical protein